MTNRLVACFVQDATKTRPGVTWEAAMLQAQLEHTCQQGQVCLPGCSVMLSSPAVTYV